MVPKRILVILVYALAPLVVALAVAFGGAGLVAAMGDEFGAAAMNWAGAAIGALLIVDTLLLVAALGVNAISREDDGAVPESEDEE